MKKYNKPSICIEILEQEAMIALSVRYEGQGNDGDVADVKAENTQVETKSLWDSEW